MSAFTTASDLDDAGQPPNDPPSIQQVALETCVELRYYDEQTHDWAWETGRVVAETPGHHDRNRTNITVDTGERKLYVTWNGCVTPALDGTNCQLGRWAALERRGEDQ